MIVGPLIYHQRLYSFHQYQPKIWSRPHFWTSFGRSNPKACSRKRGQQPFSSHIFCLSQNWHLDAPPIWPWHTNETSAPKKTIRYPLSRNGEIIHSLTYTHTFTERHTGPVHRHRHCYSDLPLIDKFDQSVTLLAR